MQLYLLRHGEAEPSAAGDSLRRLTGKGHRDVKSVARQFRQSGLQLDHCLCSPYVRAQETARDFLQLAAPEQVITETPELTPDHRASAVMEVLGAMPADAQVLLVGHNPLMSELQALLVDGSISRMRIMATSELAVVSIDIIGLGMGTRTRRLLPGASPLHD